MPVAAGVGIATAVAGVYGAFTQSNSTDNAAALKAKADAAANALAQQQEATRKQEYDAQQLLLKQQWDATQQIRAPYRAAGANALSKLGGILGVDFGAGNTTPGPTPSTPATFGTPQPSSFATSPDKTAQQNASQTAFTTGAQTVQNQIDQLPANAAGTPPTTGAPSTNPTDPAGILAQLQKNYDALGVKPTGPGTGPTDITYYAGKVAETGGLTPDNLTYWFGPTGRIASDLAKAKGGGTSATTIPLRAPGIAGLAPPMTPGVPSGVTNLGYAPIIPISGLMGRGPYQ